VSSPPHAVEVLARCSKLLFIPLPLSSSWHSNVSQPWVCSPERLQPDLNYENEAQDALSVARLMLTKSVGQLSAALVLSHCMSE